MSLRGTTPVPNFFLDSRMQNISSSSVRVYLKIVRNTLGWRDAQGGFKKKDWISHSQFEKVGVSSRSVTKAIEELLQFGLIRVTDEKGYSLSNPKNRKLAKRIYYSPIIETNEITASYKAHTKENTPKYLPTTKETDKRKYKAEERIPDHVRLQQILMDEEKRQSQRDRWL